MKSYLFLVAIMVGHPEWIYRRRYGQARANEELMSIQLYTVHLYHLKFPLENGYTQVLFRMTILQSRGLCTRILIL